MRLRRAGGSITPDVRLEAIGAAAVVCALVASHGLMRIHEPAHVPGIAPLFAPSAGVAFGYLVLRGPRGIPVVAGGLLLADALMFPEQFGEHLLPGVLPTLTVSAVLGLCALPLRSRWSRPTPATLAVFVLCAVIAAPLLGATLPLLVAGAQGVPTSSGMWATAVIGLAASNAALTSVTVLSAAALVGRRATVWAVSRRARLETAVPVVALLMAPLLVLLLRDASGGELPALAAGLLPVLWLTVTGDHTRAAPVTAVVALGLGVLTTQRYGAGEELYRAQLVVLASALATVTVAVQIAAIGRTELSARSAADRWRALVEAAPAVVARLRDGRWRGDPDQSLGSAGSRVFEAVTGRPDVGAAATDRRPALVHWELEGRHLATQVTPLPDGEVLTVTTESTMAGAAEAQLAWERTHDRETGLPNRDLLLATGQRALAADAPAGLLVVQLDGTGRRAALLGGDPGEVLRSLADRVAAVLDPDTCLLARTGDDQLGIFAPGGPAVARSLADQVLEALAEPAAVSGHVLPVAATVGLAAVRRPDDARESLRRAVVAAQAARERGGARIVVADRLSMDTAAERARLAGAVSGAVARDELEVVFQPDVSPGDGRLHGLEALVRWRQREGYAVATEMFVRVAEEVGAVAEIDAWVMRESVRQLGAWRAELGADLELGVNVSALSLRPELPDALAAECRRYGVPHRLVRLEVTETALGDDAGAVEVLRHARALDFRVALDDFGTGWASLARLRRLPVDVLKLDRSFLASIADDPAAKTLVGMVLGLAGPLRMDVVVEGVETEAQREVLVELGCERAQGFLFSPPAGAAAIREILLDDGRVRRRADVSPSA